MQVSRCVILWEEGLDLGWELCWYPKSERNTQIEWCLLSLFSRLLKSQIQLLSHTMQLCLCTSLLKMQMSVWFSTMKLSMTSVSALLNSLLRAVSPVFISSISLFSCCLLIFYNWFLNLNIICWYSWWPEPFNLRNNVWSYLLFEIPWSIELWSQKASC